MKAPTNRIDTRTGTCYDCIVPLVRVLVKRLNTLLSTFVDLHKLRGAYMGNLYENIIDLCNQKGIKGGKLCVDIGISKGLLTDLKMGRRTGVSAVTAQKIASYFGVSVGYLLGEEENEKPTVQDDGLSKEKQELFDFIKTLPQDKVELLLQVAKSIK